jgi:hypothetical protein
MLVYSLQGTDQRRARSKMRQRKNLNPHQKQQTARPKLNLSMALKFLAYCLLTSLLPIDLWILSTYPQTLSIEELHLLTKAAHILCLIILILPFSRNLIIFVQNALLNQKASSRTNLGLKLILIVLSLAPIITFLISRQEIISFKTLISAICIGALGIAQIRQSIKDLQEARSRKNLLIIFKRIHQGRFLITAIGLLLLRSLSLINAICLIPANTTSLIFYTVNAVLVVYLGLVLLNDLQKPLKINLKT